MPKKRTTTNENKHMNKTQMYDDLLVNIALDYNVENCAFSVLNILHYNVENCAFSVLYVLQTTYHKY